MAGSVLTMDRAVRNVMQFAQWELQQAVRLATLNPARVAGVKNGGSIQAGAPADLVVLSPSGEVRKTISSRSGNLVATALTESSAAVPAAVRWASSPTAPRARRPRDSRQDAGATLKLSGEPNG